ncbi:hypothetical protein EXIGLDRAFT_846530 [Exidia glandulosa HHB12029]|uniref:Uncharacterized protein n=1 Tax=Exidia glandulosa HHB12029 TaxID=1314781 RepID=A0A165AVS0_EXIGL|nr:hypothetical protein EXIGLDRAFT_846530 [Exidia glandulosa HHB12029]
MRVTSSVCRLHPQLIHFLGKRADTTRTPQRRWTLASYTLTPSTRRCTPHPQAPVDVASHLQDFLRKISSYTAPARASSTSSKGVIEFRLWVSLNFWDAPTKLTQTAIPLTDAEMDTVLSGVRIQH